ncbi:class I SAM-dependent methyltransferase [Hyalangium versicolor]|uniref:class I SAM-dependent methyltransferase n=1 Tax=Hyalangium versicolor TaxID=2861190 RepID=UPI001CCD70F6|nr:class I SAM-dependent methyltransferase [Hyalangium versicolor]
MNTDFPLEGISPNSFHDRGYGALDLGIVNNAGIACRPQAICMTCGGEGAILHQGLRDCLFGAPGNWNFKRCTNARCGMGWLDPMPLPTSVHRFYEAYYTHDSQPDDGNDPYSTRGWKAVAKSVLARVFFWKADTFKSNLLFLQGRKPGRLLEVGCGSGTFLRAAARHGWEAVGIDIDPGAITAARRTPGIEVRLGELTEQAFPTGAFDAVVMNNVLEHVHNPVEIIAECRRILAPGGRLVAVTPNLEAYGHDVMGPDWRGLEIPRHLYVFTGPALVHLGQRAGFDRVRSFSSAGGGAGLGILEESYRIAEANGRGHRPRPHATRNILRREIMANAVGRSKGEWVVLLADRA